MNPSTSSALSEGPSPGEDPMDDWLFLSSESAGPPSRPPTGPPGGPQVVEGNRTEQKTEDGGQLRSKLISAWNSVKYGWTLKQKSRFSRRSAVVMFGRCYELRDHEERERFRHGFTSLLWLTYRRGFPPLGGRALTTDSGWGCVLRAGQMLLAQGLLLHLMPPGWTWSVHHHHAVKDDMDLPVDYPACSAERGPVGGKRGRKLSLGSLLDRPMEATHRRVVSMFADLPSAPFGIHQLVEFGKSSGKKAGDWYGPSIAAHILRKAVAASTDLPNLEVYVAQDCTIYLEDVKRLCERPRPQTWSSLIILVPVRLGGQDLNPAYITCVKKLLTLESCIGIIGGKPKHSLFFIGFQDDQVLYLDPHYCQPSVDVTKANFPLQSFHCKYPRKMSFSSMDPSCTFGFYAKGQKSFEEMCSNINQVLSLSTETYPMFIFAAGKSQEEEEEEEEEQEEEEEGRNKTTKNNIAYIQRESERRADEACDSMDEFVLL